MIFITGLPCFLKIRQIFNLSDIYPYHLLQLKILQQNVIYEQKIVFCHSVISSSYQPFFRIPTCKNHLILILNVDIIIPFFCEFYGFWCCCFKLVLVNVKSLILSPDVIYHLVYFLSKVVDNVTEIVRKSF